MNTKHKISALLGLGAMFASSAVFAADANANAAAAQAQVSQPVPAKAPISGDSTRPNPEESGPWSEPWTERESLFLEGAVQKYAPDSGFTPFVVWTGEQWSNVSGGLKTGTTWDSLFTIGFEQDLSTLAKSNGLGRIGMSFFYYSSSKDFSGDYLGANSDSSNIFSNDMTRVFEIYYANEFETKYGNIGFRVGQLAADEDFMGMDYSDIFLNSNFGAIPTVAGMDLFNGKGAFSQYALATLGAVIYYSYEDFDVTFGMYNGNVGVDRARNHGFDYDLEGVAFWYQVGYNYEVAGLAGRVQVGGNYHSGRFERIDESGTDRNFYSFYLGVQQDVLADEDGNAILGLFGRFAWSPSEQISGFDKYIEGGVNWFGPIPGREDDVFAFGVSSMGSSKPLRVSDSSIAQFETCLETTYLIQLTGAITLQPTFQVYFNPANDEGVNETAYVVGARVEVNF